MAIKKSSKQLIDEANAEVKTYSMDEVKAAMADDTIILFDIRDIRELQKQGKLPGAEHTPRGMLEFWVDPESPYHKEIFAREDKEFVFYCGSAWRSALAAKALQDMGMENVAHMDGGFKAWKDADNEIEMLKPKS